MKVYLDDERQTPPGFIRAYWPEEAIAMLKTGQVDEISLDHDLGDDNHGTGYDVVLWIEEQVFMNGFVPPDMNVHSANSSAADKMWAGIQSIERMHQRNQRRNESRGRKMKITKSQLRKLIRENIDAAGNFSDSVVVGWMRMLTRYPDFNEPLRNAWDEMIAGIGWPEVIRQFQSDVGYKKLPMGEMPDRDSEEEDLMTLVGGVSFHIRKIQPGKNYPSSAELEKEIARQATVRRNTPRSPKAAYQPKYGPGGTHERWN